MPGAPASRSWRTQFRGDVDTDLAHLGRIVGGIETVSEPPRQRRAAHVGHALDLAGVGDRHDSGEHRLVDAECRQLVDQARVLLDLEEELGHGEVGDAELVGEVATIGRTVRGCAGGPAGGRRRPTRKQPVATTSSSSSMRVPVVARLGFAVGAGVTGRGPGCSRCRSRGRCRAARRHRRACGRST